MQVHVLGGRQRGGGPGPDGCRGPGQHALRGERSRGRVHGWAGPPGGSWNDPAPQHEHCGESAGAEHGHRGGEQHQVRGDECHHGGRGRDDDGQDHRGGYTGATALGDVDAGRADIGGHRQGSLRI